MLKDLHRRVLPPAFLVSYPTVAALVMLLLSPNPADRLSADELLNSTLFTQTLSVRGVLSRARSPVPSYWPDVGDWCRWWCQHQRRRASTSCSADKLREARALIPRTRAASDDRLIHRLVLLYLSIYI